MFFVSENMYRNVFILRKSAELRAMRAKIVLKCQRALRVHLLTANMPCVLTCFRINVSCVLRCLGAHVPICFVWSRACMPLCLTCLRDSRVHMSSVLMYSLVSIAWKLTISRGNMPWAPCLTRLVWPRDHLPTCFASSVGSFDAIFFSFSVIVVEVVHTVGKV